MSGAFDLPSLGQRLTVLETVAGGRGLLVDDAALDVDALLCFEVLIALDRGAVLSGLREGSVVWELEGRATGLEHSFRVLWPHVEYLRVGDDEAPAPDLALSVGALDTVPHERFAAMLARAHRLGARYAYALERESSAPALLANHFWPQEIPVLGVAHDELGVAAAPRVTQPPRRAPGAYRHLLGRRRLIA